MKVFLSHSSKDKEFVRKLGADLKKLGHYIWFDEWEIKVGDCIVQKVEQGINDSDYIIIVLTPEAVESGWVEREWKVAFGKEVEKKRVIVLPVLLKNCKIPILLSTKKYADFRENYEIGLVALTQALVTVSKADSNKVESQRFDCKTEISSLLKKIHSKTVPLSQCIAEALPIGIALKNAELIEFCKNELEGWGGERS
jgi:GTPase SAR1 family protein